MQVQGDGRQCRDSPTAVGEEADLLNRQRGVPRHKPTITPCLWQVMAALHGWWTCSREPHAGGAAPCDVPSLVEIGGSPTGVGDRKSRMRAQEIARAETTPSQRNSPTGVRRPLGGEVGDGVRSSPTSVRDKEHPAGRATAQD